MRITIDHNSNSVNLATPPSQDTPDITNFIPSNRFPQVFGQRIKYTLIKNGNEIGIGIGEFAEEYALYPIPDNSKINPIANTTNFSAYMKNCKVPKEILDKICVTIQVGMGKNVGIPPKKFEFSFKLAFLEDDKINFHQAASLISSLPQSFMNWGVRPSKALTIAW